MTKEAIFSDCKKYRYLLTRVWDESKPKAMCIGLNPSTANADKDDPTIGNLIKILTHLGYGGLYMTNLFALVSSEPEKLRECPDPVLGNDQVLTHTYIHSHVVIFCWGSFPMAAYRARKVAPMFPDAMCFGKNKNGTPMHPLALMYNGTVNNPRLFKY